MVFWALFTICCVSLYIVEPYLITSRQEELLNSAVFSPVGGALCNMMTPKSMCQPQRCSRDHNFSNDKATSNKVVISYAHNGFGNQLWEHSFAWQVAESIGAQFYIMPIEQSLWRFGKLPQNTIAGLEAMKSIFPSSFFFPFEWIKYNKSMAAHMHAPQDGRALDAFNLCEKETFSYSDRLIDVRGTTPYALHRNNSLRNIIKDTKPRCLKFVGHFMNSHAPRCLDSFRKLWLPHIGNFYRTSKQLNGIKGTKLAVNDIPFSVSPQSAEPGLSMDSAAALVNLETQSVEVNDVCIYLRCKPAHYLWNTIEYYQTVLSRLIPDNSSDVQSPESAAGRAPTVWLFESPECFTKTKHVHHVLDFLRDKYKARRWLPSNSLLSESQAILEDVAGLTRCSKLLTSQSSWAEWASWLSDASEIHVNAPPYSHLFSDMSYKVSQNPDVLTTNPIKGATYLPPMAKRFIFHDQKKQKYFGQYNYQTGSIGYGLHIRPDAESR